MNGEPQIYYWVVFGFHIDSGYNPYLHEHYIDAIEDMTHSTALPWHLWVEDKRKDMRLNRHKFVDGGLHITNLVLVRGGVIEVPAPRGTTLIRDKKTIRTT